MLPVWPRRMVLSLRVSLHHTCRQCSATSSGERTRGTDGDVAGRAAAEEMACVCGEAEDGVALLAETVEEAGRAFCGVEGATEGGWVGEVAVEVSGVRVGREDAHGVTYGEGWSGCWGSDPRPFKTKARRRDEWNSDDWRVEVSKAGKGQVGHSHSQQAIACTQHATAARPRHSLLTADRR